MQKKLTQSSAVVWSQTNCPACVEAKRLLDNHAIKYKDCMLGITHTKKDLIDKVPTARSVPQIFLDGKYVGGLPELKRVLLEYDNDKTATME
jgi:glutaredoxin 3